MACLPNSEPGLNDRIARLHLENADPRLGIPRMGRAVANHLFMQKTCAVAGYSRPGLNWT